MRRIIVDGQPTLADLAITKLDDADPVEAGGQLTYTVTVANLGEDPAAGVVVTEILPAGVTFVSTTGCAEDDTGVPTCSLGAIPANGQDRIHHHRRGRPLNQRTLGESRHRHKRHHRR